MILVEIFLTSGCGKCAQARTVLKTVAESFDAVRWREVNILDKLDYAVELGVLSLPAIAIDGKLVFSRLPSAERLRETLALRQTSHPSGGC